MKILLNLYSSALGSAVALVLFVMPSTNAKAQDQKFIDEVKKKMPHTIAEVSQKSSELPRETTVFHWSGPGAILYKGPATNARDPQIREYLTKYSNRYWALEKPDGLYFALDPASSSYAGSTLLMIDLKKGSRFFNATSEGGEFSTQALDEIEAAGCSRSISLFGRNFGRNLKVPISEKCNLIRKAIAQITNVKFFIYDYEWRELPNFCSPKLHNVALVVFDPTVFVADSAAIFDPLYSIPPGFFEASKVIGNFARWTPQPLADINKLSAPPTLTPQAFKTWGKSHLFDCAW